VIKAQRYEEKGKQTTGNQKERFIFSEKGIAEREKKYKNICRVIYYIYCTLKTKTGFV
jgi:hypothetical protein